MTDTPDLKPETLTAHGGRAPDALGGDVAPPLRPSTNYARDANYQQVGGQGDYRLARSLATSAFRGSPSSRCACTIWISAANVAGSCGYRSRASS